MTERLLGSRVRVRVPSGARLRWGVVAAGVEGMTTRDAPYGEPGTAQWAVRREALDRVVRTGWLKAAAGAEEGRNKPLVAAHEKDEKTADGAFKRVHGSAGGGAEETGAAETGAVLVRVCEGGAFSWPKAFLSLFSALCHS